MQYKKSWGQAIWDFIGIPFRLVLFDQEWLPALRWTTLEEERVNQVLPHIKGHLLDIGAGNNTLVKAYGEGVGVDVFDWGGGAFVVEDTSDLDFPDATFDTIAMLACLNHIPYRLKVLQEAHRLIKPDGQLIVTMINPVLGGIGHRIWWYSEDKKRGGMLEGELGGMWMKDVIKVCNQAGFALEKHQRFVYGMNNLYIFRPKK